MMSPEAALRQRIEQLLDDAAGLAESPNGLQVGAGSRWRECTGWLIAALHAIETASGGSRNSYFIAADRLAQRTQTAAAAASSVGAIAELLRQMRIDMDAGLLGSIADRARAETFDNFLDHGRAYLREGRVKEAGVIVGVVFEDSVRRICRKLEIAEENVQLDSLISALAKIEVLTGIKAKRARAAAAVRTSATHARWEEFTESDVAEAAALTRELISEQLEL